MHFDVVLSVFIHQKAEESSSQYSCRVYAAICVRALQMCAVGKLLTQRSTAYSNNPSVPSAVLISSPDT